jgi:hypothetical protein
VSEAAAFEKKIRRRDHANSRKAGGELLAAYWNDYNGSQVAITEIDKIAEKPCQALFSVFS